MVRSFCPPAVRAPRAATPPRRLVSDNFLDQLIGHRLHESVKGASRHRQLVDVSLSTYRVAHERVFNF